MTHCSCWTGQETHVENLGKNNSYSEFKSSYKKIFQGASDPYVEFLRKVADTTRRQIRCMTN